MKSLVTIIDEPNNINVDVGDIVTVVEKNHSKLNNLDFEHSGHTGFASLQDLENVKNQIRVNSFTYVTLSELGTAFGIDVSEVKDEYSVTKSRITYRGKEHDLSNGDTFYIVQSDVPDYWFSLDNMKLYKQETKVDMQLGIEQLVGTEEKPINFATDMRIGNMYHCTGNTFWKNGKITQGGFSYFFLKTYSGYGIFMGAIATDDDIFSDYTDYNITGIMFDSTTGKVYDVSRTTKIGEVNGYIFDHTSIYAPTMPGTEGQILQSNGEGEAPTWTTPNFATIDDINNAIGNVSALLGDTDDLEV